MSKSILPPIVAIIVVTVILVILNEFTEMTFIKDYAMILIIVGMFLGIASTKISTKSKKEND